MTIEKKIEDAVNKQINNELFSQYLYLSMSANFETMGLKGMANWMKVQAQEEFTHAMRLYDYLIGRGGKVVLDKIEKPKTEWKSPLEAFEEAYKHEQFITSKINELVDLANSEKDHATSSMLKWFVDEQVEEEASVDEIVQKLKHVQNAPGGNFIIDQELGKRVLNQGGE